MPRRRALPISRASVELYNQFTAHKIDLLRFEESMVADVYSMFNDVQRDTWKRLQYDYKVYSVTNKRQLSKLRQARLAKIHDNVAESINEYRKKVQKWHDGQLVDTIQAEFEFYADAVNTAIGTDVLTVTPALTQIKSMASDMLIQGAQSKEWWAGQADDIQRRFMRAVRTGMYEGEGIDVIARRIFDDKKILRAVSGAAEGVVPSMKAVRNGINALVRTSVQTASGLARDEMYAENDDLFSGEEYVATLDGRTTQMCMGLDGLQWDMDGVGIGHNIALLRPPMNTHWNCRSWMNPIVKTWEELSGVKIARKDGTKQDIDTIFREELKALGVPAEEANKRVLNMRQANAPDYKGLVAKRSYNKWLQDRPESFQRKILGASKFEMYKSGKLNLHEMIDQKGNPLTVQQLRDKISAEKRQRIPSL